MSEMKVRVTYGPKQKDTRNTIKVSYPSHSWFFANEVGASFNKDGGLQRKALSILDDQAFSFIEQTAKEHREADVKGFNITIVKDKEWSVSDITTFKDEPAAKKDTMVKIDFKKFKVS